MPRATAQSARLLALGALLSISCKRREDIKQEPRDAAPEPCVALNNEASALMLAGSFRGDGGPWIVPGAARAVELYEQACPHCTVSCANLARALIQGNGTTKNVARALRLYEAACAKGDMLACVSLANQYSLGYDVPIDEPRAELLYRKACEAGHTLGCSNLAGMYRRGDGGPTDPRARALYEKDCAAGTMGDCANLGVLLEESGEMREGTRLYERACDGGIMNGCLNAKYADAGSLTRLQTSAMEGPFRRID